MNGSDCEAGITHLSELQALLTKQVVDLRAALLVYDVTLSVVGTELPKQLPAWVQSQINAAQDAYRQVTGEEPLSLSNRPTRGEDGR